MARRRGSALVEVQKRSSACGDTTGDEGWGVGGGTLGGLGRPSESRGATWGAGETLRKQGGNLGGWGDPQDDEKPPGVMRPPTGDENPPDKETRPQVMRPPPGDDNLPR